MFSVMLRAAELPAIHAPGVARMLHHAHARTGQQEPFEIAEVSPMVPRRLLPKIGRFRPNALRPPSKP